MFTPVQAIAQDLAGRSTILGGEIVHPRPGRPADVLRVDTAARTFCLYAFDLLWLDGRDLRDMPCSSESRYSGSCFRGTRSRFCMWITWPAARNGDRRELTASFI